ncbi:MAG: hypothetical protein WDN28_26575 [Chthoniobacter sp.]
MRAGKKLGQPVIAARLAILTKPLNGRAACFYATNCGRGCAIGANFQSTTVLIPPAMTTGNLDILTGAMAREVTLDDQGAPPACISSTPPRARKSTWPPASSSSGPAPAKARGCS